jgi:catechol 2,3-dioxygenase-like lactoylglutathione lyase family enzyme
VEPHPLHIAIVTGDLDASMRDITAALGVSWTTVLEPDGTTMYGTDGVANPRPRSCVSREGPVHIDLMQGEQGTVWEATDPRIHHVAYRTDDLPGDVTRLREEGWRVELALRDGEGRPTVFAYLVDSEGRRIELMDDAGCADYENRLRKG